VVEESHIGGRGLDAVKKKKGDPKKEGPRTRLKASGQWEKKKTTFPREGEG